MKRTFLLFLGISCAAVFSVSATSTNSVYWDFASMPAPALNPFSGLAVSDVSRGNNDSGPIALLNATSPSGSYTTAAGFAASGGTNAVASGTPGAFNSASSTYFGADFSLSPLATYSLIVNDVSLGSRSTSTGPSSLQLYASADGFVSDFESLGGVSVFTNSTWTPVDFSSLSLDLNPGDTLSFRLYGDGGTGTSGPGNWRIDDLAFTLTPVPEPSSIALALIGGLVGLSFRRVSRRV